MHAAIKAALEESWIFEPKETGASWAVIKEGNFGAAAGMLRAVWFEAVAKDDPFYFAGKLEMFPIPS